MIRCDAPFSACGCSVKSGVACTDPSTRTMRLIRDSSPTADFNCAIAFSAETRNDWYPSSTVSLSPSFPVYFISPSIHGSWPDV